MIHFQTWFQERGVYLLPDSTPVVARYCDLNDRPRWWFVEKTWNGQIGQIVAVVLPDGNVWNYVRGPDSALRTPQRSDLTVADLCPVASAPAARDWLARIGQILALLWAVDGMSSLLDVATTFAA